MVNRLKSTIFLFLFIGLLLSSVTGCKKVEAPSSNESIVDNKVTVETKKDDQNNEEIKDDTVDTEEDVEENNEELAAQFKYKPADNVWEAKDEYVFDFIGLKLRLSDAFRAAMENQEIAMLDYQSPLDEDLEFAMLTFDKMNEEQRNATYDDAVTGQMEWEEGLERVGTISMVKADMAEDELSIYTKCDTHKKLGATDDGLYAYYLSTNSKCDEGTLNNFKGTDIQFIDKKDRPENGYVLIERSDSEEAVEYSPSAVGYIGDIETEDIDGDKFTGSSFADSELTMVHIFATWCEHCVKEIPEMVKLKEAAKDEGVNIIGIVVDSVTNDGEDDEYAISKARDLKVEHGINYPLLKVDKTKLNGIIKGVKVVPYTFFVDKNGNVVGDVYQGDRSADKWMKIITEELQNN